MRRKMKIFSVFLLSAMLALTLAATELIDVSAKGKNDGNVLIYLRLKENSLKPISFINKGKEINSVDHVSYENDGDYAVLNLDNATQIGTISIYGFSDIRINLKGSNSIGALDLSNSSATLDGEEGSSVDLNANGTMKSAFSFSNSSLKVTKNVKLTAETNPIFGLFNAKDYKEKKSVNDIINFEDNPNVIGELNETTQDSQEKDEIDYVLKKKITSGKLYKKNEGAYEDVEMLLVTDDPSNENQCYIYNVKSDTPIIEETYTVGNNGASEMKFNYSIESKDQVKFHLANYTEVENVDLGKNPYYVIDSEVNQYKVFKKDNTDYLAYSVFYSPDDIYYCKISEDKTGKYLDLTNPDNYQKNTSDLTAEEVTTYSYSMPENITSLSVNVKSDDTSKTGETSEADAENSKNVDEPSQQTTEPAKTDTSVPATSNDTSNQPVPVTQTPAQAQTVEPAQTDTSVPTASNDTSNQSSQQSAPAPVETQTATPAPTKATTPKAKKKDKKATNSNAKTVTVKKVSSPKIKATKKKATITWKKTKNAKKYQIAYRLTGKYKKGKKKIAYKWTFKTTTNAFYTIKGLKKNKKYDMRVRAVNGSKYGKWSSTKTFIAK